MDIAEIVFQNENRHRLIEYDLYESCLKRQLFYGCYFLKMLMQQRKGIRMDQIGQGKVGFVKFVEVTMKIATLLVPAAEVISIPLNTTCFLVPFRICGAVIGALGAAVFVTSVVTMRYSRGLDEHMSDILC